MLDPKDEKLVNQIALDTLPNHGGNPARRQILELNAKLRNENCNGELPMGMGYLALNIPPQDYRVLMVRFPELASTDPEIQLKAWKKFLRDPRSEPYKVRRNDGKLTRRTGVIVR